MGDGEEEKSDGALSEEEHRRLRSEIREVTQEIERKYEEDPILSLYNRPEPWKEVNTAPTNYQIAGDEIAGELRSVRFYAGSDLVDRIERIAEADDKAADEVIRAALWEYVDDR